MIDEIEELSKFNLNDADIRAIKEYWKYVFEGIDEEIINNPFFEEKKIVPLHPDINEEVNSYFFFGKWFYRNPVSGNYTYDIYCVPNFIPYQTTSSHIDWLEEDGGPAWCGVEFTEMMDMLIEVARDTIALRTRNFFTNNLEYIGKDEFAFTPYSSRYECARRGLEYNNIYDEPLDDEFIDDDDEDDEDFYL